MKKKHLFLSITLASLLVMLMFIPFFLALCGFSIGEHVNWVVYYYQPWTLAHGITVLCLETGVLTICSCLLLCGPILLLLPFIFLLISKKKEKLIIPAYILTGIATLVITGSMFSIFMLQGFGRLVDGVFNFVYIGVPVGYSYGYYGSSYVWLGQMYKDSGSIYQSKSIGIVNGINHTMASLYYACGSIVCIVPIIFFVLSLIFIKDWKKKQKPEEPDVDIPLVEAEPLGEMKL